VKIGKTKCPRKNFERGKEEGRKTVRPKTRSCVLDRSKLKKEQKNRKKRGGETLRKITSGGGHLLRGTERKMLGILRGKKREKN